MKVLALLSLLALGGCITTQPEYVYSRSEVDAINAESQCKMLARNLVQVARCARR